MMWVLEGMGAHTAVITELKVYTPFLSVSMIVTVITQSPLYSIMQPSSISTLAWKLT